jgi:type VI secretion system secreted protein Hcp
MAIYLKLGDIKGDVTAEGHKDWIEVHSCQFGIGRGIATPTGNSADRESSAPSVSEITVTKNQDIASIKLFEAACGGSDAVEATINFTKTEKNKTDTYMTYILSNVLISGYSVSSGGDRPTESLSLNFTKIEFKADSYDATNKTKQPSSTFYDIALGKLN